MGQNIPLSWNYLHVKGPIYNMIQLVVWQNEYSGPITKSSLAMAEEMHLAPFCQSLTPIMYLSYIYIRYLEIYLLFTDLTKQSTGTDDSSSRGSVNVM